MKISSTPPHTNTLTLEVTSAPFSLSEGGLSNASAGVVLGQGEEHGLSPAQGTHKTEEPQAQDKREKKRAEPEQKISARQLLEIQGNPQATADNAARVQHELSPPTNPYPSVQELATVRRAQALEQAAREKMKAAPTEQRESVDKRV